MRSLDGRIIDALHIDGRASWARIAEVLGENERTVARRGSAVLASGTVRVVGVSLPAPGVVLRINCGLGQSRMTSAALGALDHCGWAHVVSGNADVVAALSLRAGTEESRHLMEELPATAGAQRIESYPVIEYLRLARWWNLGILTPAERSAMWEGLSSTYAEYFGTTAGLGPSDMAIVRALREDGRMTYEELGRRAGVSEVTARRRVDQLREDGVVAVRAVADPAATGFHVEVLMWLDVPPRHVKEVAAGLRSADHLKFVARLAGPWDFIVKTPLVSRLDVDNVLPAEDWVSHITRTDVHVVVRTDRRSYIRVLK
ncbi:AsnC family transcriptional regulator [Ornithinimicrobium pratense]|uniref:AsnC family transcriptional regulator n=1 Tax=Ornithinimicrobium pratense TaxID=2593973 RepID=A0A5J6V654_9MICO|nr:AsnC family transcriptional regulator [Ornithinimicrobium pratense]QFG69490.1 AsnC family transcriptional regulator [Ornithinimicrobium pratense]